MLAPFIVFTQRTFRASGYIKKRKKGCAVPNSVMGCIQPCPEKDLKHLQKPDVISQHVLSRLNAPSCSLALGHSITKYCFSTCDTKRFLKAAGRRAGGLTIGPLFAEWFAVQTPCQRSRTQERHSTSELQGLFSHLEKGLGRDFRVASKRLRSSLKPDIQMSLKESRSPPQIQGESSRRIQEKH